MINKFETKNLDNVNLEDLIVDIFNYLSKFMSYKEMIPLLLASKKLHEMTQKCPSGQLAAQLLPKSQALANATTKEFLFKNVLQTKNIKPLLIVLASLLLLSSEKNDLFPIYMIALGSALAISTLTIKQESHNFGLFKHNRSQQIKEIEKPLYSPVNS